ncbi:alpha/beta hydrolase [Rhodococcus opacus]|uniref:Putative carboxylesterase n=1 Tax=Rhodococcus opacus (strain B4) TaxID=632772 RepID=C1BB94_RHOOB|nr:alpha/beta hydrolase [Rhodococcus opacus]BAH52947.1 putative carboxylesterase [Rhodococcus opacus B4]
MAAPSSIERQIAEATCDVGTAHQAGPECNALGQTNVFLGNSIQSKAIAHLLRVTVKPALGVWARVPSTSWAARVVDQAARVLPPLDGVGHRRVRLMNCDADWIQAHDADLHSVVLYLHGGGFLSCGLNTHRRLASRISQSADASVLSVDYRLMPTHTIDDAVADGIAGYQWLLARGFSPAQIVIAGDSAGGYLAFMVALALDDLGLPRPAGLVALSPLTDLDPAKKLQHSTSERCPVLPRSALSALSSFAMRVEHRSRGVSGLPPSPVDADLRRLPPVLLQVGSKDLLYPDSRTMFDRLVEAGVPASLEIWDGQFHVFQVAADLVPEARKAIARVAEFIRGRTTVQGGDAEGGHVGTAREIA